MLKKSFILSVVISCFILASLALAVNVPPSSSPPGGLQPEECPQFVNIGFDDNYGTSGIQYILSLLKNMKNPSGKGNIGTFDATPARVSFYITASYSYNANLWNNMVSDGHEVANHTVNHYNAVDENFDKEQWEAEINTCNDSIVRFTNINVDKIVGFRVPYLAFNNEECFEAIASCGLKYDCSLHGGSNNGDGSNFNWPYTMDGGNPGQPEAGNHAGLWEVPTHYCMKPNGDRVTGLDFNMIDGTWGAGMDKNEYLSTLKNTLDLRYNGNRVPFTFGGHSHYYGDLDDGGDDGCPQISVKERQQVIKEFFEYALTKPDVRIVTTANIIKWMKNPVKLNDDTKIDTIKPSETLLEIAGWEAIADDLGSTVDTGSSIINNGIVKVDFKQVSQPDTSKWPWVNVTAYLDETTNFEGVKWIKMVYKCDKPVLVSLVQPPLSEEGTSYQYETPSASGFEEVLLRVSNFKQPSWLESNEQTPYDAKKINCISFQPTLPTKDGGTASLEIKKVILYDYTAPTGINSFIQSSEIKNLSIGKITNKTLNITVPSDGNYSIVIYSINGQVISSFGTKNISKGAHAISWNGNVMPNKLYLISLKGNNNSTHKKAFLK